jgi:hypothetical protein
MAGVEEFMAQNFGIFNLNGIERYHLKEIVIDVVSQSKKEQKILDEMRLLKRQIKTASTEDFSPEEIETKKQRVTELKEILPNGGIKGVNIEATLRWLDKVYGIDLVDDVPDIVYSPNQPYTSYTVVDMTDDKKYVFGGDMVESRWKKGRNYLHNLEDAIKKEGELKSEGHAAYLSDGKIDQRVIDMIKIKRDEADNI